MKTRIIIGFALLLVSILLNGQESNFEKFERYFTWDPDSTSIYANPDLESKELVKLPYGTEVNRLEVHQDKVVKIFIGELDGTPDQPERLGGYALTSFWVQVEYGNVVGYAPNAEVINFPPYQRDRHGTYVGGKEVLQKYFKNKIVLYEKVDSVKVDDSYWPFYTDSLSYPDGSYYTVLSFDGCFDRTYHFENKSMDQVYFMFKTEYYDGANGVQSLYPISFYPSFIDVDEKQLSFEAPANSAAQDLFIRFSKNLEFGSYDCT